MCLKFPFGAIDWLWGELERHRSAASTLSSTSPDWISFVVQLYRQCYRREWARVTTLDRLLLSLQEWGGLYQQLFKGLILAGSTQKQCRGDTLPLFWCCCYQRLCTSARMPQQALSFINLLQIVLFSLFCLTYYICLLFYCFCVIFFVAAHLKKTT